MELGSSLLLDVPFTQPERSEEPAPFSLGRMSRTEEANVTASQPYIEHASVIPSKTHLNRAKPSSTLLWPAIAVFVGVTLLLFSLCGSARSIHSGTAVRRLATRGSGEESSGRNPFFGEEEWIPLDADELAVLCLELGGWAPTTAPQSVSSPSIRMPPVVSTSRGHAGTYMLQGLQTPSDLSGASTSEQGHRAAGQYRGQRISHGGSDGWGPSPSKVRRRSCDSSEQTGAVTGAVTGSSAEQRLAQAVQQTTGTPSADGKLLESGAVPTPFAHEKNLTASTGDIQGVRQTQFSVRSGLQQSRTIPPETSTAPPTGSATRTVAALADSEEASASESVWVPGGQSGSFATAGPAPNGSGEASAGLAALRSFLGQSDPRSPSTKKHPFVRVPTLSPHVRVSEIEERHPQPWSPDEPIYHILRDVRNLFLKPALSLREANQLVSGAIRLARRALSSMTSPVDFRASVAAEALGRRFLVFNAFHTVLKLTGGSKPYLSGLWRDLVAKVPTLYTRAPRGMFNDKHRFHHELSYQLSAALELYKSGSSPSEEEMLDIKRKLFCMEFSPHCFRRGCWDLWRHDDANFTEWALRWGGVGAFEFRILGDLGSGEGEQHLTEQTQKKQKQTAP
ncbi:LOW QUALITY PROTEIN: uncharacterized protein EMH_0022190 [Eimeria mitis]|uniref:Uncharacterized protein n=1 Tax=Eimeria mitis TaxID=44415 RepID=U6KDA2_9EIME|nr:LOW QUALITY PROTEIN: uncharacterized protein EMH_0022190 [Eimeria mitis]CDJ34786.1 hypothetical protein EMH_0022190 [Eimeria mitis]